MLAMPQLTESQIQRFWFKVEIRDSHTCWPWTGSKNEHGYGGVRINDRLYKAPRIAYYLHYGADPSSYHVLHKCDNPPCVNPHHLFLGTIRDNAEDSVRKGRSKILYKCGDDNPSKLHPDHHVRGQDTYNAKLANDDVIQIRWQAAIGMKRRTLARNFGVSYWTICDIVVRRRWKHIQDIDSK